MGCHGDDCCGPKSDIENVSQNVKNQSRNKGYIFSFLALALGLLFVCIIEKVTPRPHYAKVFYRFGLKAEENNETERAINFFNRSLQFDPTFFLPHHRLGLIFLKQGELEKALQYLQRAVYLEPGFWHGFDDLGLCLLATKEYRRSILAFQKATGARNVLYEYHLGVAFLESGDIENAKKLCRELASIKEYHYAHQLQEQIAQFSKDQVQHSLSY